METSTGNSILTGERQKHLLSHPNPARTSTPQLSFNIEMGNLTRTIQQEKAAKGFMPFVK